MLEFDSRMSEPFIRFRGVGKAFGPKLVYRSLDMAIERGEVVTVVGGSGVGKSVMLKMLIGLLKADRGSIVFDGEEITAMSEGELAIVRQRIAMLFQSGALFDSLERRAETSLTASRSISASRCRATRSASASTGRSAWSTYPASRRCDRPIFPAVCASASLWRARSP